MKPDPLTGSNALSMLTGVENVPLLRRGDRIRRLWIFRLIYLFFSLIFETINFRHRSSVCPARIRIRISSTRGATAGTFGSRRRIFHGDVAAGARAGRRVGLAGGGEQLHPVAGPHLPRPRRPLRTCFRRRSRNVPFQYISKNRDPIYFIPL